MQVHAASFIRERRIVLDQTLLRSKSELSRILTHEMFHFAWFRLGNRHRRSWEQLLLAEFDLRARGELGWSAEMRKVKLAPGDSAARSRLWREYACESFCDTAAWLFSGSRAHPEFTLARRFKTSRRGWFSQLAGHVEGGLRI